MEALGASAWVRATVRYPLAAGFKCNATAFETRMMQANDSKRIELSPFYFTQPWQAEPSIQLHHDCALISTKPEVFAILQS